MNDEPRGKRRPHEQSAHRGAQQNQRDAARAPHNEQDERKPMEKLIGDWRGAGVCGDRHTD